MISNLKNANVKNSSLFLIFLLKLKVSKDKNSNIYKCRKIGCVFTKKSMRNEDVLLLKEMRLILYKLELLVTKKWKEENERQIKYIWKEKDIEKILPCIIKLAEMELLFKGFRN